MGVDRKAKNEPVHDHTDTVYWWNTTQNYIIEWIPNMVGLGQKSISGLKYGVRLGMNSSNVKAVTFLMIKHTWFKESETARSFKVLFLREIPSF